MSFDTFLHVMNNSFYILRDLDSAISEMPHGSTDWVVTKVSFRSLAMGGNKTKMVAAWKWYMSVPLICDVLRKAGYDHIVGYEGSNNNIIAYGVLYPENLKRLNP